MNPGTWQAAKRQDVPPTPTTARNIVAAPAVEVVGALGTVEAPRFCSCAGVVDTIGIGATPPNELAAPRAILCPPAVVTVAVTVTVIGATVTGLAATMVLVDAEVTVTVTVIGLGATVTVTGLAVTVLVDTEVTVTVTVSVSAGAVTVTSEGAVEREIEALLRLVARRSSSSLFLPRSSRLNLDSESDMVQKGESRQRDGRYHGQDRRSQTVTDLPENLNGNLNGN